MTQRQLCFVLMPFGTKPDGSGGTIDFDAVYNQVIKPAIDDAELDPLRADEEMSGGIIHKPMFERLLFCPFAVADLTTANANVFYELGVRHTARPWSTVLLFAAGGRLPFDVGMLRALPYRIAAGGAPADAASARNALAQRLIVAKAEAAETITGTPDSPLFQLIEKFPDVDHTKTDVFRDRVDYDQKIKARLRDARKAGVGAIRVVEHDLGALNDVEAGVLVDLLLSYRAVEAFPEMIALVEHIPKPIAETVLVQEQFGFALNRAGRREDAERVLMNVIERHGPSSETYGLLGRVYKDQWEAVAAKADETLRARGLLDKAVNAYLKGFETDWRDAYPGVNAVTLMELKDKRDPRQPELLPVVAYAARRRIAAGKPDYWDYATLVELGVLSRDAESTADSLASALAVVRESWEPKTTARNLRLIQAAREKRGENTSELAELIAELERTSATK